MKRNVFLKGIIGLAAIVLLMSSGAFGQSKEKTANWRNVTEYKDATFYDVQQDFNEYWKDKTPGKGQGYKPFKRWENYMAPRVYPSGDMSLPSTTYHNYMEWQKKYEADRGPGTKSSTGNWTSLGPVAKPSGYDSGVGRVDFVRFDPTNSNAMYVGATDGGLWKTTDGGATWTTNTDFLPIIGCADLAIAPNGTMYLATGNWEEDRRSIGVLKSTNGGASWDATALSWTATDAYVIRRLIMDPTNSSIMMVATNKGVFRTADGWATLSTTDMNMTYNFWDIKFKPGTPNTVYAIATDAFWMSSNNGVNWTNNTTSGLPTTNVSRALLGVTAANSAYVYVLMGNEDYGYKGLYRSTNSGVSFTTRSTTPNILHADETPPASPASGWNGGQANHDLAIAVSPTDADKVTIGGINQWRSTNGGTTWANFTYWYGYDPDYPTHGDSQNNPKTPYTHADIQDIQYLPNSSTTMFATADGGIYKTTDDGLTWTDLSSGLSVAQQTSISLAASDPDFFITGLQDIGSLKKEAGTWSVINGGDGEDGFIRRNDKNFYVTSNPNGAFSYTDDNSVHKYGLTGLPSDGEWISPIKQDPINDDLIYAGGWPQLYKTTYLWSNGETAVWTTLGTPPGTGNILQFVVAPSSTSIIYAIKEDKISKSTNSGVAWTDITGSLPTGAAFSNLAVSNTDPLKVWVTYSGYTAATKVYKTTNGGTSWTNISTGLPNLPMTCIVYHNGSANDAVYLGADIGVYYMDNSTSSWEQFNTGLPNCNVRDLEIYYPTLKLRAATYGRGSWESDLHSGPATWVGTNSTDWNTAANWSTNEVPDAFTSVIIVDVANDPVVNQAPASPAACRDLTITSGVLTISSGKALTVSGTITNSVGATGLIIKSDATGIGSLIHSTTGVDGTVERYTSNADWTTGVDGWTFLSSPVASQAISTNFTTTPYDFYAWYETTNEWVNFKNTTVSPTWNDANGNTNFTVGHGYMAAYDAGGIKEFSGSLNVADVSISGLTISGLTNGSWHLLGNPFSAALTWDAALEWERTNIGGTINIWNEIGQSYSPIVSGGGVIPATNGFMAQVNGGTGSLVIPASKRTHNAQNVYKSTSYPVLKLFAKNLDYPSFQESQVRFNPAASTGYDLEYDGYYLPGYAPQFYSVNNNENYIVNSLPEAAGGNIIPFSFIKNTGTNFEIEVEGLQTLQTTSIYLKDNKLGIMHDLSQNAIYTFTSVANDAAERFELHVGTLVGIDQPAQLAINAYFSGNSLYVSGVEGTTSIGVYNVQGQKIEDHQLHQGGLQSLTFKLAAGVYFARITNDGNTETLKMIVQ